eukprot:928-Pelagomonas_calceolata.AAC.4
MAWNSGDVSFAGMDTVATGTPMETCSCVSSVPQSSQLFDCALEPCHILHAYLLHLLTGLLKPTWPKHWSKQHHHGDVS